MKTYLEKTNFKNTFENIIKFFLSEKTFGYMIKEKLDLERATRIDNSTSSKEENSTWFKWSLIAKDYL